MDGSVLPLRAEAFDNTEQRQWRWNVSLLKVGRLVMHFVVPPFGHRLHLVLFLDPAGGLPSPGPENLLPNSAEPSRSSISGAYETRPVEKGLDVGAACDQ